jgi:hypothetical protein
MRGTDVSRLRTVLTRTVPSELMKSYDFKLILAGVSDVTDDQGDALYEAGCDDGTVVSCEGEVVVRFTRESTSLEQAINSAAVDVERAGFQVDHVEVHCPI